MNKTLESVVTWGREAVAHPYQTVACAAGMLVCGGFFADGVGRLSQHDPTPTAIGDTMPFTGGLEMAAAGAFAAFFLIQMGYNPDRQTAQNQRPLPN